FEEMLQERRLADSRGSIDSYDDGLSRHHVRECTRENGELWRSADEETRARLRRRYLGGRRSMEKSDDIGTGGPLSGVRAQETHAPGVQIVRDTLMYGTGGTE